MNCPKCNYPDGPNVGDHYKGIYTSGEKCPGCGFIRDASDVPLTAAEYQLCQDMLVSLAQQVRSLPLGRFMRMIERAETAGPVLDPTLFLRGQRSLAEIKKMAEGALGFQNALPPVCAFCKVAPLAYAGAVYCGAACSARAEAQKGRV